MSVSPSAVPGDQYLGGMVMLLYQTIRAHFFLVVALPLIAAIIVYFGALQLPTVHKAQGSIRIGKMDGEDAMSVATATSRINSPSFKQRVVQSMNLPVADGGRSAQVILRSLTAKQDPPESIAAGVNATTAEQARGVLVATVGLLNEEQSRIWGPLEADIREELAATDASFASLQTIKQSLSEMVKEEPKEPSGDLASAMLHRLWLADLISRNEQRLAAVTAERRVLTAKLSPSRTYSTALADDVFVSSEFAVARPSTIAILAGALVFLVCLIGVLLRGRGVPRWDRPQATG